MEIEKFKVKIKMKNGEWKHIGNNKRSTIFHTYNEAVNAARRIVNTFNPDEIEIIKIYRGRKLVGEVDSYGNEND